MASTTFTFTDARRPLTEESEASLDPEDQKLIEGIRQGKNGDRFEKLWGGDWRDYELQDRANRALCFRLAYHVKGDPERIDRLYRQSGLYQKDEWNEEYDDGRTYGEITIAKVLRLLEKGRPKHRGIRTPVQTKISINSKGMPIWPDEVMTGAAGQFAKTCAAYMETPESFLYMSYLTFLGHLISDKVTLDSELRPQPRFYTVLLGESAWTRKTTSIDKAMEFFLEALGSGEINPVCGAGSGEGLAKELGKNKRVILILDELKALIQKMRIDGATLLPCINTLFELGRYQNSTSQHSIKIDNAELCILSASTLDTYRTMFTRQFLDIGFLNRIFVVLGESQRRISIPQAIPGQEALKEELRSILKFVREISDGGPYMMPMTAKARRVFDFWYKSLEDSEFSRRLDTYGHRLLILLAVNEKKKTITSEIAEKTVTLLNYQLAARKYANPIDADNAAARLERRILEVLANGSMKKRDLERACHKDRVGTLRWNTVIKGLLAAKEIQFDEEKKTYERLSEED